MLHQMQGAYYVKGFSKHGPLHNPHAYGYFDHVPYKNFKGGHVTCGGILYDADVYPKEFRHQYIAGNLLSNAVHWHKMTPKGASFTAEHGGELIEANDTWFRPVDLQLGPDGCVYVADWYDKRAAHLDPIDNWDKTNGRVYKIEYTGAKRLEPFDLRKKTTTELIDLLKHPNVWWRREARRLLAERPADRELQKKLSWIVYEEKGQTALEALWAWYVSGGWAETHTPFLFRHDNPDVRAWTVRFLGDAGVIQLEHVRRFMSDLAHEKNPVVLAQLLCSARRLPAAETTSICLPLRDSPIVAADPHLPHLLWWAVEPKVQVNNGSGFGAGDGLVGLHTSPNGVFLAERFARLAATAVENEGLDAEIYNLFQHLPLSNYRNEEKRIVQAVMRGFDASPHLNSKHHLAKEFEDTLDTLVYLDPNDELLVRVAAKLGVQRASDRVRTLATDDKLRADESGKWRALAIRLGQRGSWAKGVAILPAVSADAVRADLLAAIGAANEPDTPAKLLAAYPQCKGNGKQAVLSLLLSRPKWALALFQAHADGKFPKADLTVDHARAAVALNDPELTKLVEKQFGKLASTAGEKRARIDALNAMFGREKPGDPAKGKAVFAKSCAACHQLFGEGGKVGPDLTSADRKNRYALLTNIVDPSGYIRPEFVTHVVNTLDGRTYSGVVTEQTAEKITLANYVNNKVETTPVARKDIDKLDASAVSLMPEKLLDVLSETEIRDLVAYVMQDPPVNPDRKGGGGKKLKVALISGSVEYKSDDTLPVFQKLLEDKYPVECVRMFRKTDTDIPGLDKLSECDMAIFFTRRLKIDGEQLKAVKAYCESGKPVIGLRTASHGFQNWLEMDKEVFGGNYKNHYGAGPKCETKVTDAGKNHPILKEVKPFASEGSLYKNPDLPKDVTVLLTGTAKENTEPIAWARERKVGEKRQRVFYTSLGHPKDFEEESFTSMLRNAIGWATGDERLMK